MNYAIGFAASAGSTLHGARIAGGQPAACARPARHPRAARWSMMADEKPKNPLAGLGGIGNIMDAMKKAQKFTSVAKDLQTELQNTEIETTVREGQVKVILSAQQMPIKVEVSEELVKLGHEEVCFVSRGRMHFASLMASDFLTSCSFFTADRFQQRSRRRLLRRTPRARNT